MIPSCQTLSKAFDISKKTPLTLAVNFHQKQLEFYELLIIIGQYMNLLEENQIGKV